jgi:hypothetical protein
MRETWFDFTGHDVSSPETSRSAADVKQDGLQYQRSFILIPALRVEELRMASDRLQFSHLYVMGLNPAIQAGVAIE